MLALLFLIYQLSFSKSSIYKEGFNKVEGKVIEINESKQRLLLKTSQEKIIVLLDNVSNYHLGDILSIEGELILPSSNKNFHLFQYQEYLKRNQIFYEVIPSKIDFISSSFSPILWIREKFISYIKNDSYLLVFLLGDKSNISNSILKSYQENGISHLFAISGMHISLLSMILHKILRRKFSEEFTYKICVFFLLFYLLLIGFSPSILRGVLFYIFFQGNQIYYFYIKKDNLFLLVLSISLFMNPYFIYDAGFQFSYSISFALFELQSLLSSKNYYLSLLKVSITSFLVSFPICLYHYFEINILGILYNLFFVPFISFFLFPFSFITFFFPFMKPIYHFFTTILENVSLFLSSISFGKVIFQRLSLWIYLFYEFLIFLFCIFKKKIFLILFFFLLLIHFLSPFFDSSYSIHFIDVGQGDSILLKLNQETLLIDTGGKKNGNLSSNILIPYFHSFGISSIDYLILSHGDYDHMGETISLIQSFPIKNVIFNCGELNDLEKSLITVLEKKNISYYSCIKQLNLSSNIIYFLNSKEYDNENDNSNVIYTKINHYQFLFMGDAGVEREKELIQNYSISNIDVLKVGHHGSKTSSSKEFIDEINPKYSIISVGKNNRYGHPNLEVLNHLNDSKIYRTDQEGSILFRIHNNHLKINTCVRFIEN